MNEQEERAPERTGSPAGEAPPGPSEDEAAETQAAPREETPAPAGERFVLQVRYGALPTTGAATTADPNIHAGAPLILRTARGTEFGCAVTQPAPVDGNVRETVGQVVRVVTNADLERQREIDEKLEPEEMRFCRLKIAERGIRMRLSRVEHLWGGERIVFYFTAEKRVDFRALVRDLAWHFHCRIELRQIGARDEARLLADFEHCGRPLCCKVFLRSLEPVTMRMAKLQRTTLDPHKISGRCGRLMCCLRFEDGVYRELRRGLPNRGTRVLVGNTEGEVVSADILTQQVTVRVADGETVRAHVTELRPPCAAPHEAPAEERETEPGPPAAADARPRQSGRQQSRSRSGGRRSRGRSAKDRKQGPDAGAQGTAPGGAGS